MLRLFAGVARADITPPVGIAHAGWGAQTHERAVGVDLPLSATVLALSDGERNVVIVDLDHVGVAVPDVLNIRAALGRALGLPPSHIRISWTHLHSGAATSSVAAGSFRQGSEMVGPYNEYLVHQVVGVAWAATRSLRPVRFAAARGTCRIGVNRRFRRPEDGVMIVGRNWEGPVDHEVAVIRIDGMERSPLAAVVNYACHPATVGPDNDLISPDYPGVVRRVVEQATGATCLFLQGAAGNILPVRGVACGGLHEYRRLGAILGHEASRVWWEMELPPRTERYVGTLESGAALAVYEDQPDDEPDARLGVAFRSMHLPLRELPPPEPLEAQAEDTRRRLDELRVAGGTADEIRQVTMLHKRAAMRAETARKYQGRTVVESELQVFTIGARVALVAVSGEPFVEIGLAIKRDSPFPHTLFSGYSNAGCEDYIPTADAFALGGYEVEITPFRPEAAAQVVEESLALLREMAA